MMCSSSAHIMAAWAPIFDHHASRQPLPAA